MRFFRWSRRRLSKQCKSEEVTNKILLSFSHFFFFFRKIFLVFVRRNSCRWLQIAQSNRFGSRRRRRAACWLFFNARNWKLAFASQARKGPSRIQKPRMGSQEKGVGKEERAANQGGQQIYRQKKIWAGVLRYLLERIFFFLCLSKFFIDVLWCEFVGFGGSQFVCKNAK